MKTYNFKIVIEPDEDFDGNPAGWRAFCPALESIGGSTWGETREHALKNINEVVHMIVQDFIEEGRPLPEGPHGSVDVTDGHQLSGSAVAHRQGPDNPAVRALE